MRGLASSDPGCWVVNGGCSGWMDLNIYKNRGCAAYPFVTAPHSDLQETKAVPVSAEELTLILGRRPAGIIDLIDGHMPISCNTLILQSPRDDNNDLTKPPDLEPRES
ncbi:hypothetical protein VC83_05793 [Pseudogymnoascus destructans]|uniref:Uncharacterized protein n=2 Tax=Pseudogymnoascus destructans TaxID=655981 RepID=L8FY10_PSED2|nr:uncharacterized protein VC83_05793 [Pseudogymnoascus destructans]ELR05383.1 hypothetical protein GMDG_07366 [Pseudogymnoascus destructans 20631-21]OAF57221.1 hypothetical protein VC83_05793 [Pseudogymnoascus destructans]